MESADIDEGSLQAVKSLRSKFERLATESAINTRLGVPSESLILTAPASPRRRATSSSQVDSPSPEDASQLRSSISSSDLKTQLKRPPPPPPPPRGSKLMIPSPGPSPAPSPLLRPVPIPPFSNPAPKDASTVSVLKNRLDTPPSPPNRITTPRQSISSLQAIQPEAKPAVPLRPSSLLAPARQMESDRTNNDSPFSDEEQDSPKPSRFAPPSRQHTDLDLSRKLGTQFSDSSYDSEISQRSSRQNPIPPPRPPRHHLSASPNNVEHTQKAFSLPTSKITSPTPPPPLPVRRSTIAAQEAPSILSLPPPLPTRSQIITPNNGNDTVTTERKALGSNKLPPPPTRTIALGDKLPAPRRPNTPSSDEDSGEEDEPKVQAIDLMPDSSTSSRHPPVLGFRDGYSEPRVHVNPQSGCVALSGSHAIVGHGHHVKIYDLALSEVPTFSLDTKELGLKDSKVTCMEIRPTISKVDSGFLLWVGTKDGHIFELDIRTGTSRGTKYAAHLHPIAHLFRHGRSMISLDESGKTLIFSPDPENREDITLLTTIPRVMRTTDKQDFVRMIDGKLWTAARNEHHGVGTTQRLPVIRVYDIFNPANTGRSILPIEHVGPVTSATIIPTQPRTVYVGHEEGFISIWELDTEDGFPLCVEVMKVSVSDVLSLEGVNNRLWAGSRNGMISAYDVSHKPWIVTNCWIAHPGVPVMRLLVNHYAVAKIGTLCVASIGRDEHMRIWDGLLGSDWVDNELVKSETSFSFFHDLTVLIMSWNCDSSRPDSLTGAEENFNFLSDVLHSVENPPDIIVFGFQEVIDLESRKMVAKNVILGGKKKPEDGGLSDKVTGAYKRWYDRLILSVKTAMPQNTPYCVVHTESLVGLFTCIFAKNSARSSFDDVSITTIKRGMGGRYGNKGGIVARLVVGDSSICFINCHLAAGQNAIRRRNADIASMLEDKAVFAPTEHPLAYVGGGDGSMVLDHEFVILNGDLNYRIDHRREAIIASINAGDLTSLLLHDQLLREIKFNRGCRLRGFTEGLLTFNPTYKYDPRSNTYDSSEKRRSPAWCDRVLWRSRVPTRIRQLHYRRYEANVSDHRPISAAFAITVKTFDKETREKARAVVQAKWADEQKRLLDALNTFYKSQALI